MNPNESLAVHIFENTAADPGAKGPLAQGAQAVGLAQIWDKHISRNTNTNGWKMLADKWGLRSGQDISDLKTIPEFSIDYLAWRMAGSRNKYRSLDEWYRSPGYNPNFTGDTRGSGPSIYVSDNASTRIALSPNERPSPVAGGGTITSVWGDPRDGGERKHEGVDIAAPFGTPLLAVADGKIRVSLGGKGGNAVHINNTFYYAHLSKFAVVNGQMVKKGDVIGYVGNSGSATGPHLHFAIFLGRPGAPDRRAINPLSFLQNSVGMPAGVQGELWDVGENPESDDLYEPGLVELPGGGPRLPGGGPGLPAGGPSLPAGGDELVAGGMPKVAGVSPPRDDGPGKSPGRRVANTWKMIAQQEGASPLTGRYAGIEEVSP